MKATIEVKIKPFQVPDFVLAETEAKLKQEGMTEVPKYALSDLSVDTLEALCEKFTKSVFEKAGKGRPPQVCVG